MDFDLRGLYRVQGSLSAQESRVSGNWLVSDSAALLNDGTVNLHLQQHNLWAGSFLCTLKPAIVSAREGTFASRPDILYKRSYLIPAPGSQGMETDIVDVLKAKGLWEQRSRYSKALLGEEAYGQAVQCIGDVCLTIANEYYVHEAGHGLGYDVDRKSADGYFYPGGRVAPGLIALEELRADMHAQGWALLILPEKEAQSVFVYTTLLRFGVHLEALASGKPAPYGLIPYLLFRELLNAGLATDCTSGEKMWVSSPRLLAVMHTLAEAAERRFTIPECTGRDPIEAATPGARFLREAIDDHNALDRFHQMMEGALRRLTC